MPRPRKYAREPKTGKTVDGVSHHPKAGYYIINPQTGKRDNFKGGQYFGHGESALWQAKAKYDEVTAPAPIIAPSLSLEEARQELHHILVDFGCEDVELTSEIVGRWRDASFASAQRAVLLSLGVDDTHLAEDPELWGAIKTRGRRINPEWAEHRSEDEIAEQTAVRLFRVSPQEYHARKHSEDAGSIRRNSVSVKHVGNWYGQWYKADRMFRGNGKLRPKQRQGLREQQRYFQYFVDWLPKGFAVAEITDETLRGYRDHVRCLAVRRSSVADKTGWVNKRLEAVKRAFRRVKRERSIGWPQGMFGTDGFLNILEQTDTEKVSKKQQITRKQFQAMLSVSDTQWTAILHLSLNVGLKNQDVSDIEWRHLDFDNRLVQFTRGKTGRYRNVPLAAETVEALQRWRDETTSTLPNVFITWQGTPWITTTDSIGKHWGLLQERALRELRVNIPVTFMSLRQTASSVCFNKADTDKELAVKMLLGLAHNSAWKHYVDVAPDFLHKAVEAIAVKYFDRRPAEK